VGTNRLLIHEPDALPLSPKNRAKRPSAAKSPVESPANRPPADRSVRQISFEAVRRKDPPSESLWKINI